MQVGEPGGAAAAGHLLVVGDLHGDGQPGAGPRRPGQSGLQGVHHAEQVQSALPRGQSRGAGLRHQPLAGGGACRRGVAELHERGAGGRRGQLLGGAAEPAHVQGVDHDVAAGVHGHLVGHGDGVHGLVGDGLQAGADAVGAAVLGHLGQGVPGPGQVRVTAGHRQ